MLPLLAMHAAFACDPAPMSRFAQVHTPPSAMQIETTTAREGGVNYTGARVAFRSASPVLAWRRVLQHPELQDEWHPKELGTERVERIEGTDFFQRTNITVLGAIHIRRQLIARVSWLESTPDLLHTCWKAGSPDAFAARVHAWDDGSTYTEQGFGGWTITTLPEGGALVDYQVWVASDLVPSSLVKLAITRTLPTLLGAFEARVAALDGHPLVTR